MAIFDVAIEALELAINVLYEKLVEYVLTFWEENLTAFNEGQVVIYNRHIQPEVWEWLANAGDDWPWADAGEYEDNLWMCYDGEVMQRAFSDVILAPIDKMWQIIEKAIQLEEAKQMLEIMSVAM